MADDLPPIELIPTEEDEEAASSVVNGTDPHRLHTWLRTAAVMVGALALLWMAVSMAGSRDAADRQACFVELQSSMFGPSGLIDDGDHGARLVERAEDCGLPLFADTLRQEFDLE